MLNKLLFTSILILVFSLNAFAVVKSKNLQAGWRFEEGSGTSTADIAGNANSGSLQNTPTWTTGKFGRALSFNGTNEYVLVSHSASLNFTGQVAMAAWINVTAFPGAGVDAYIVGKGYSNPPHSEAYYFRLKGTTLEAGSWNGTTDFIVTTSVAAWSTGQWHHVVGMYDGTNWILYIDGVQAASAAWGTGAIGTTRDLTIGAYTLGSPSRYFNGIIDEVRVYNRSLRNSEIRSLMLGYEPGEY